MTPTIPSTLNTKLLFFCFIFNFSLLLHGQETVKDPVSEENINEQDFTRQRFAAFSLGYNAPITTGDNFMGNGLQGKGGINFRLHIYPYKQIFVGFGLGENYFRVKDRTVVGNYNKTSLSDQFLYVGYEFLPAEKIRIGVLASLVGSAQFENKLTSNGDKALQNDNGRIASYGFYFNYELGGNFMVYLDYAYKSSKTDIMVPQELESTFNRGTFHNIGIGLVFVMGTNDFLSRFLN